METIHRVRATRQSIRDQKPTFNLVDMKIFGIASSTKKLMLEILVGEKGNQKEWKLIEFHASRGGSTFYPDKKAWNKKWDIPNLKREGGPVFEYQMRKKFKDSDSE